MSQIVFTFFGRNQLNVKLTEKPKPKRMRMMIETLTESRSAAQAKVKWVACAQTYWLSIKKQKSLPRLQFLNTSLGNKEFCQVLTSIHFQVIEGILCLEFMFNIL